MFRHPDPEVLVVGAGPVGLVAALFLHQQGIRVEIVDMHQRTTQHSYALVSDAVVFIPRWPAARGSRQSAPSRM